MDFLDEQIELLKRKHADPAYVAPNLQNIIPQDDNDNEQGLGTWLAAAGIGAGNMLNNLGFGGFGQLAGTLGAGVENFSPFSGSYQDDRYRLMALGFNQDEAQQLYPDVDSWLTSLGKGSLEIQNAIGDKLGQWRNDVVGDNPSYGTQVAEGVGSSLGFMAGAAALAATGNPILGALIAGGTEALSESGGTLGEAYRQGRYDGGLSAANKSFLANAALNAGLDYGLGFFSPFTRGIRNPITRFAAQTAGSVVNELLQEPSQQTIEKAAQDSIYNGGNFMNALGQRIGEWPQDFLQLAPSVAGSSLITSLLTGGAAMLNPQFRQQVYDQYRNRMYDPEQTANELISQLDARQKLINQLQREKSTVKDEARIKQYEADIANADSLIATLQDRLKPGNFDYTPSPYDEFSGKISPVTARAGQAPINTAFSLIEADDIITSHNDDFSPNQNYNQALQNRDRGKLEAQNNVINMSDNLDPALLGENPLAQNGAPILDANNQAISGNGRILAIRRAYAHNPEKAKLYRQSLIDNAQQFGIDPDLVQRMKHPVLVRSILDGQDFDLVNFARQANEATTEELSAGNIAVNDTEIIRDNSILKDFDPAKDIGTQGSVLSAFISKLPQNQQNKLLSEGKPTINAVNRLKNAVTALAYPRREIIRRFSEAKDGASANIFSALQQAAPYIAKIQANAGQNGGLRQDLVIGNDIATAALWLERFRKNATDNLSIQEQINQSDIQSGGDSLIPENDRLTPERKLIIQFLYDNIRKPDNIFTGLFNYAQIANNQPAQGQGTLFGGQEGSNLNKMQILRMAFGLDNQLNTGTQTAQNQQKTPQEVQTPQQGEQDNNINPQGSTAVINRPLNVSDALNQQQKSGPGYADDITDPSNLRQVAVPRNQQNLTANNPQAAEGNSETVRDDINPVQSSNPQLQQGNSEFISSAQNQVNSHDTQQQKGNIQPIEGAFKFRNFAPDTQVNNDEALRTQQDTNPAKNSDFQGQGNSEFISSAQNPVNSHDGQQLQGNLQTIQPVKGAFNFNPFTPDSVQSLNDENLDTRRNINQRQTQQQLSPLDEAKRKAVQIIQDEINDNPGGTHNANNLLDFLQSLPADLAQQLYNQLYREIGIDIRNEVREINGQFYNTGEQIFRIQNPDGLNNLIQQFRAQQQDDNLQQVPKPQINQSPNHDGVQNQQDTQPAQRPRNYIPPFADRLREALRTGKKAVRYIWLKHGENEPGNPHKLSFDAKFSAYDGYIGDFDTGIGDNSSVSHAFFGLQDGHPFVGLTDKDGNFVATFDVRNSRFYINEGFERTDLSRRIEDDFRRAFGNNPTEEILRRTFMFKAINAGLNPTVADASSRVYMAGTKYFAHYSGQSLLDTVLRDNLSIKRSNRNTDYRGDTTFIPEIRNSEGNIIQEARTLVSLYRNADASTLLHETGHIFLRKLRDLYNAGILKNDSQAAIDWGIISREYGLKDIDFSRELSGKDLTLWRNANEKFAASFEKYFRQEEAPKSLTDKMRQVFNHFKDWLKNIYRNLTDITYTDARGRKHNNFTYSEQLKGVFDRLIKGSNDFSLTESNGDFSSFNSNQGIETYTQGDNDKGGFFGWLKRVGKHLLHPLYSIAHVTRKPSAPERIAPFLNPETERRFTEAGKAIPQQGRIARALQPFKDAIKSIRGGDYAEILNSPRINDKDLNLRGAVEALRTLERNKKHAIEQGRQQILKVLKTLNPQQQDLFNRLRVLQDLNWQIKDMPNSQLPFDLTPDEVRKALKQYTDLAHQEGNEPVLKAIQDEERNMREINDTYMRYAGILGVNMDGVFRNPHYYRHRIIQYAQAIGQGKRHVYSQGNQDIQDTVNSLMWETQGRSWLKKRKGSSLDFITDYMQANAEVRIQQLQDIETMKTLLEIKKEHDIAPRIRKNFNLGHVKDDIKQENTNIKGAETFSQSAEGQQESILDHIPDGHEAFDLNGWGGIEGNKSVPDNILNIADILNIAVSKIAEERGLPLESVWETLGIVDAGNNIMVIPSEIAESLRKMAKSRHRGALAQAAKDLTTWWKRSVLFTPMRNLLYNIRNFTGDLDALIAGNPSALKFLPQSVKEFVAYYTQNGKEGYQASQDLQDYIRLSGSLGIPSLNLSKDDARTLVDLLTASDKDKMKKLGKKKGEALEQRINDYASQDSDIGTLKKAWRHKWNLIAKLFDAEHKFTEMREHLLRFAAYLDYKHQMETNKDKDGNLTGKPSNWGASIEEEVMSIDDIKKRAFKMSNELLGAYDQVSEIGKQLRDMLIPFYSWMEVNMRRTYRLLRNGFKYGYGARQAKQLALGKAASMPFYALSAAQSIGKLMLFTGAMQMFNRFVFPDADDDLPNDVKYRPHITLGKRNGQVYYFDRIGAIADALDWGSLDSFVLDAKDFANGQKTLGSWFKQMIQAPFNKVINGLNPAIKMPIELAMGRSMFPDAFNPSTIRDPAEYVARSFGMAWPYKAITGKPHDNLQELSRLVVYSQDADEAAYWQTLDRVRQFQNQVLDKHFDGFASTARGRILQNIKKALRYKDNAAIRRYLREYTQADGTKQGLQSSMKAMNPLHGLSEKEKAQFMKWISPDDRKYLRKAMRYYQQLTSRFIH